MAELCSFTLTSIAPASLPDLPEPPLSATAPGIRATMLSQLPRQILTSTTYKVTCWHCTAIVLMKGIGLPAADC